MITILDKIIISCVLLSKLITKKKKGGGTIVCVYKGQGLLSGCFPLKTLNLIIKAGRIYNCFYISNNKAMIYEGLGGYILKELQAMNLPAVRSMQGKWTSHLYNSQMKLTQARSTK